MFISLLFLGLFLLELSLGPNLKLVQQNLTSKKSSSFNQVLFFQNKWIEFAADSLDLTDLHSNLRIMLQRGKIFFNLGILCE